MTPSAPLPVYLTLVAISKRNCVSVPKIAPLPLYLTLVAISGRNCVSVPSTALLPVYLALVAISRRNCVSIPSNQQVVVDASAQLSESVTKFKEFLEPFATILPTNDQIKDIPSPFNPFTNWKFPWTFLIFLTIFGQF